MVNTLKEISAPPPASSSASIVNADEDEDDETAPLAKDQAEPSSKSAGYGTGELRRRVSSPAGNIPASKGKVDKDEVAETGAVEGGVMAGALDAVKGESAGQGRPSEQEREEEDESSDDGAVLVARPDVA